jgi:hypothetical protein
MQLGAAADEPGDAAVAAFYRRLLAIGDDEAFHAGDWRLLEIVPAGDDTYQQIAAWRWTHAATVHVVVVNLGRGSAQGHVRLNAELPPNRSALVFQDLLNERAFPWSCAALESAGGLYVRLGTGEAHVFRVD